MSELRFDYKLGPSPRMNKTERLDYSIQDIYNITRGTFKEFDLKGYTTPKTAIPMSPEYKIPLEKNRDIFSSIRKRSNDPSPVTYAADKDRVLSRFWYKATGKFHTYRRHSTTEDAIKRSLKTPGPGAYLDTKDQKQKFQLGKFKYKIYSKNPVHPFLSNTEAISEEVPGSNHYFVKLEDREKALSRIEKKPPGFKYYPDKKLNKTEKQAVGPGYLNDLEESFKKKSLRKKTPDTVFGRSNVPSMFHQQAQSKKYVPGVGAYKDVDRAYKNNIILPKTRVAVITKDNIQRFTDTASKEKQWVPGPGSYNIIPYSKKN